MDNCSCGAARRRFWVWRDSSEELHASSFEPTNSVIRRIIASTSRDALLPIVENRTPKHDVQDEEDPTMLWEGRCGTYVEVAG